ncbi:MAG: DAK2 domain-containing protein [Clostridia bacterium]|nr:DAK2 domain-containing protein [Clostridia bacterium]
MAEKKQAKKSLSKKQTAPTKRGIRYLGGQLLLKMAQGGAAELRNNADEVNKLNVFPVPDGDTGDNMMMTIESGVETINGLDTDNLAEVMHVLSHGMLLGARGNSGVILSQFFAGIAKGFEGVEQASPKELGKALEQGVEQAYTSVMTPTEGTILTVARESVEYAVKNLHPQSTIKTFFQDLVDEMHASLDRTPEILTVLKEANVVDSGGAGLLYIFDGFNRVLNGKEIPTAEETENKKAVSIVPTGSFGPDSEMTYGYCTELLIQLQNKKVDINAYDIEPLKQFLAEIGDSVVAFKTESIVKVHVHTLTPERVLAKCREIGEFLTVKIENMSLQHTESEMAKAEQKAEPQVTVTEAAPQREKKRYGIVAVCNGQGLIEVFTQLGADIIVEGGQTCNPSTNDFLAAFAKVNADNILVFPNNSNIFMAATQAAEMYTDARVLVVPSKYMGTGYVALAYVDQECEDADAMVETLTEAMANVKTGYISPSIRDADIGGVHIEIGDTIGIINKEIVVSDKDKVSAALRTVDAMLDEDRFMLTIIAGADTTEEERNALGKHISESHPDIEIYVLDGGQEIYPYIFVAE